MKRPSAYARQQRSAYLGSHPLCEYSLAIGRDFDCFKWAGMESSWRYQRKTPQSTEIDHLWGRNGPEDAVEHPSNYMAAHSIPHKWKTDNDRDGRIVALYWKWLHKDKEPEGWDLDRMRAVFGQRPLGWLANQLAKEVPVWVRTRAEEVLA